MPRLTWTVRVSASRSVFVDPDKCVLVQTDDANAFAARGVFPLAAILNTLMRPRLERELGPIARIQAVYRHPPTGLVFVDVSAHPRTRIGDDPRGFFAVDEDSLSAALHWQGFDDDTFRAWVATDSPPSEEGNQAPAPVARSASPEAPKPIESEAPPPPSLATDETPTTRPASQPEALTPPARAVAAAYDLQREGKPISVRAACERAKVDRANLRKCHPDAVALIGKIARPDRAPRRGMRDRRTGELDGVADYDGRD